MNIYNMSSGDSDPSNDYISMQVVMDADSYSNIKIYNSGLSGIIEYETNSDYIWSFKRVKYISNQVVPLSQSQNQKIGYPDSIPWIPGDTISPLSNSKEVEVASLKGLTDKSSLSDLNYEKSGKIILEDIYDDMWNPSGVIKVSNVYSTEGNMPFVQVDNSNIEKTGSISLYSSSLAGCIFNIDIKKNFLSGEANQSGSLLLEDEFSEKGYSSVTKGELPVEWNSIFEINKNCNADSIFKNGKNRDEVFMDRLKKYLDLNWYNKLKRNLWGEYIEDESLDLSSRDPEVLKNHIYYCFYYFGASDDFYRLAQRSYGYQYYNLSWHIGLGGKSLFSNNKRGMREEISYLPVVNKTKKISKVYGLPPRTSYSYNLGDNINMANFTGILS